MARRGFARSRVFSRPRPFKQWVNSADQAYVAVGANASIIHQSRTIGTDETVLRTRGIISSAPQAHNADINVVGAVGFAYVSEQAAVAGAASIPGPYSNAGWDGWFVHMYYSWDFEFITSVGISVPGSIQQDFDSKAMRKAHDNQRMVIMVESQADAQVVSVQFRQLLKIT